MAIPKKGSRHIVVDDKKYRWMIRRKATSTQADYGVGKLNVAVEKIMSDNKKGTTLLIISDRPHPKDWRTTIVKPTTPNDVAVWIREALAAGWQPDQSGAMYRHQVVGTKQQKKQRFAYEMKIGNE